MGFIHCWSSTSHWVVAFIALLTIGPADGMLQPCVSNPHVLESVTHLKRNTDFQGHLAYHVEYIPKDEDPGVPYKAGKTMFKSFNKFKELWNDWINCDCAKALCNDKDKNLEKETFDCYNVPKPFFYSQCADVSNGKCTKVCNYFIAKSVLFKYGIVKVKLNRKKAQYCWMLRSAYIYNEKDCDSFMGWASNTFYISWDPALNQSMKQLGIVFLLYCQNGR